MSGRPTSLTPEVQATIVAAIETGNYRDTACRAAGVSDRSLRNWCERGETGEEPYASFFDALQAAEAKAEMALLAQIKDAQAGTPGVSGADLWQSRAWVMERRWPKRWAARVRTVVAEEVEGLLARVKKDPELARKVADVLADEGAAGAAATAAH